MPRLLRAFQLVGLALLAALVMFALSLLGLELSRADGRIATVWPANAVLIVWLLRSRRSVWPALLAGAYIGNVAASLAIADPAALALAFGLANLAEIGTVAALLGRDFDRSTAFGTLKHMAMLGVAAVASTCVSTSMAAIALRLFGSGCWSWRRNSPPSAIGSSIPTAARSVCRLRPQPFLRVIVSRPTIGIC